MGTRPGGVAAGDAPVAVGHARRPRPAGDLARAQVAAATTDGDRADALLRLALVSSAIGRDDVAALSDQVSTLARRAGDHVLVALALNNLAEEELRQGDVAEPPPISAKRSTTPPSWAWSISRALG